MLINGLKKDGLKMKGLKMNGLKMNGLRMNECIRSIFVFISALPTPREEVSSKV